MATEGVRQGAPVKLTRPNVDRASPRQRLFDLLDTLRATPVLWLGAPAGSGKTTLLSNYIAHRGLAHLWYRFDLRDADPASFFARLREAAAAQTGWPVDTLPLLTPEYLSAAEVFTRNFFETLFGRLTPSTLIVFDDFHELPDGAALHTLLPAALGAIPDGIHVAILSRAMPPPPFANLRARGGLRLMEPEALTLRLDEAMEIARLAQGGRVPEELVTRCHAQTVGWVAGLILLLEYLRDREGTAEVLLPEARETLFDYFATQVLMDIDGRTRRLLFRTAFMPQVTAEEAVALSALEDAPARLESLARNNFFTTRLLDQTTCYQYHPLFQEFLQAMAPRHLTEAELAENKSRAATALMARSDLGHAVTLLVELRDWPSLSALVMQNGGPMMAQGRHLELLRWVEALPVPVIASSPWLLFWKAVATMPKDKEASYVAFAEAYRGFLAHGDVKGAVHAWSGAVESLVVADHDIDRMDWWRERLQELLARGWIDEDPMLEAALAPLALGICIMRGTQGIEVERWVRAALWAVAQPIDATQRILASFALAMHFHVSGQREQERFVLETQAAILKTHTVTPLALLTARFCGAFNAAISGDAERCRTAVEEGHRVALQSGIHHWTFALLLADVTSTLIHGDVARAREQFRRLAEYRGFARAVDVCMQTIHLAWLAMLEGRAEEALHRQQLALDLAEKIGQPHTLAEACFGLSQALHATGRRQRAIDYLDRVRRLGEEYPSQSLLLRCDLMTAFYALDAGEPERARAVLTDVLHRAGEEKLFAFFWWLPETIARLCAFALENGIETDLVCRTIRHYGLRPATVGMEWPRPVRLRTLGPLVIEVDNQPIAFVGKAQKKPLELLQALIALGGNEVREERLAELLWSDADGDAGIRNLHTTLYRLRKLLRHEEVIEVRRGALTINPEVCGLDTWALEALAGEIPGVDSNRLESLLRRLLDLYRGNFLTCETDAPWMYETRERLRITALKCFRSLGAIAESSNRPEVAITIYTRALAIEPRAEELQDRLTICHGLLGNEASTLAVYPR